MTLPSLRRLAVALAVIHPLLGPAIASAQPVMDAGVAATPDSGADSRPDPDVDSGPEGVDSGNVPDSQPPPATDAGVESPDSGGVPVSETEDESESEQGAAEAEQAAGSRRGTGVDGTLLDAESEEGVPEGTITVVGRDESATSDLEGRFFLELPPGRYTLRALADLYRSVRVSPVVVGRRRPLRLRILLPPDPTLLDEVEVVAQADTASATGQIVARRESATVRDAVSAQEIARSGDSTASAAVRRVVGASVVDGQYLYVRGLGGRYTAVLLNGVPLPATDPDVIGVQLDLIPASLLTSLAILKTFSPDLPADVAGGIMQISTRDLPTRFTLSTSLSLGGSTTTTFSDVLGYEGGNLGFLGLDDGTRALPDSVPRDRSLDDLEETDRTRVARDFRNIWALDSGTALPDVGLGATVGHSIGLGAERRFGFLASLSYSLATDDRRESLGSVKLEDGELTLYDRLSSQTTRRTALWGALGTMGLTLGRGHEIRALTFYSRAGQDSATFLQGVAEDVDAPIASRRLRLVERSLWFNQLFGEHENLLGRLSIRWQGFVALGSRAEPDTRTLVYFQPRADGPFSWYTGTNSGERLFSDFSQLDGGGSADASLPLGPLTPRIGGGVRASTRSFETRRFLYLGTRGITATARTQAPEDLFSDANVGEIVALDERTRADDSYESDQQTYAGFAMLDARVGEALRLSGGLRLEVFRQVVESGSRFAEGDVEGTRRTDLDLLPSASAVLSLSDSMDVRLGYSETVARPQIRELAPVLYFDFIRRRSVQGEPDLQRAYIHNFDVRWEWFLGDDEVLAASVFYKHFIDAIEPRLLDQGGNLSYTNTDAAQNFGAELEARWSLGRISRALESFSVGANLTLVYSRVSLSTEDSQFAYSRHRPLAGQSPYVANLSLGFSPPDTGLSVWLYYNLVGRRLQEPGSQAATGEWGIPDTYEQTTHNLDLVATWEIDDHWSLRFAAKNLLLQEVTVRAADYDIQTYPTGTSFSLRLGWSY